MEETHLKLIKSLIATRIGLLVREQDEELLRKVVAERIRALDLADAEQYCQLLRSSVDIGREREELAIPLTTGETYFFRDGGQHALLKDRILPELMERCRTRQALRIWSAACSSGEEAYSIAILLDELKDSSEWDVLILGTDINRHAIDKARRGIYTEWSFRGMSEERRQRYFHRRGDAWMLDERIRDKVRFRTGDLVADAFPDQASELHDMDLILCRNTFIYMAPDTISHVAAKFAETLADGGILITGHSELFAHHLGQLRTRIFPESVVYQKAAPVFAPPVQEHPAGAYRTFAAPAVACAVPPSPAMVPAQTTAQHRPQEGTVSDMQQAWRDANKGLWTMAEKTCKELIARNPLEAEPRYLLALIAQEHGDFAVAKEQLKKVIYLAPAFVAAYLDLADLYARESDGGRARRMRATARDLLKELPPSQPVKLYGPSTADEVLQYVVHLLNINDQ